MAYTLRFEFTRYQDANSVVSGAAGAVLLVDSVSSLHFCRSSTTHPLSKSCASSRPPVAQISLMPRHSSMEMFNAGDPASGSRRQSFERYRCHEAAKAVSHSPMSGTCSRLISSMSAIINHGALRECPGCRLPEL